MRTIETDYLVVGAGASGMAFVDSLINASDADVVLVDRRHRPGGHWLDAYPFVRIHQTSVNYGVNSRVLGTNSIDEYGPNAGFYERATADEICDYYSRVLEQDMLPSGRVRFFGMSDYRGSDVDGHHFVSLLTGEKTTVNVRRRVVDAAYVESEIPSRHTPSFEVDEDVRLLPPNNLIDLAEPGSGFTIIGAGKTSNDTCNWLLEQGVAPDKIRWIRPRDGWVFDRALNQPLENVGSYMQLQARWVQAAAEAETPEDFPRLLETSGVLTRIDGSVEPRMFRGAIQSAAELDSLRSVDNVVRLGKVRRIGTDRVVMDEGEIESVARHIYVNCTARGVRATEPRPIFKPGRITLQYVTIGIVPWGAATIGVVEGSREDDAEKNRLCPAVAFTGNASDVTRIAHTAMVGLLARGAEPDLAAWNEASRLNPGAGAMDRMDDPRVPSALASLGAHIGPAMKNLQRLARVPSPAPA